MKKRNRNQPKLDEPSIGHQGQLSRESQQGNGGEVDQRAADHDRRQAKGVQDKKTTSSFIYDNRSPAEQTRIDEEFVAQLEEFLKQSGEDDDEQTSKSALLQIVGKKTIKRPLDRRQFDVLLRALYRKKYLRIAPRKRLRLSGTIRDNFDLHHGVWVVAGNSQRRFAQAGAEVLVSHLQRISSEILARNEERMINLGIVSGGTVGAVIRAASELDWEEDLGIDPKQFFKSGGVRVFALNVCLTVKDHLSGNANVLVHQFYEKLKSMNIPAEPFGLSAPLLVKMSDLKKVDNAPQTREVIEYTEPSRLQPDSDPSELGTKLDIVLTSVGEKIPPQAPNEKELPRGSIFYSLAKKFGFEIEAIQEKYRVVGDFAFNAISAEGEPIPLEKEDGEGKKESYCFFSAVSLPVLREMARDPRKVVILLARHDLGKDKVPAIFASIRESNHRYASGMILDEVTARNLIHHADLPLPQE
jgi:hypothetical protein